VSAEKAPRKFSSPPVRSQSTASPSE